MAVRYYNDVDFIAWLNTEIHAIYVNGKKVVPYKPALVPAFVLTLATKSAQKSYKKDFTNWKKYGGRERLIYEKYSWMR